MYKSLILPVIIFLCVSAKAQTIVRGKIVDAQSRQPLDAALVVQKNNNNAKVITNHYGSFVLKVKDNNAILITTFIGYKPDTTSYSGKEILIQMQRDVVNLKDIIIVQNNGQQKFNSIAKIDLNLKPVKNTQELLRIVPGLFVAQHAGGGKAEQIFLRGFDCDHGTDIQISVDGIPVNMVSHGHGQGYADAHFIIPETINNIDYGTGPYYTQHGNLNTAGYVNFSTYNNIPQSRIQVEAGRYNTFRTLAMIDLLKKNKDKQSAYIAGEFNYTDGATINKQNFNRFNLFGKYNLVINNNTQLTTTLSGFKSKWDASGQIPERAVKDGIISRFGAIDPSEGGNTERYNANVLLTHHFKNNLTWENQAYYSRYIFNLYSNFTFYLNDAVNGDEINQAEKRNVFGYLSKLTHKRTFNTWSLNSVYGAGIRYDAIDSSKLAHVVKRQFLNNIRLGNIKEANTFAYTEQQVTFGKWFINTGVRVDYLHFSYFNLLTTQQMPSRGKSIVSPKLNIQYTVNNKLQLYAKAGKGFHSNDTRVVVANEGHEILPAAYGADIGVTLKPADRLLLNVAAWYLHLNQEFVYVGDEGVTEPSGKTKRKGIDILARYQFTKKLFGNVNINFTKPRAIGEPKGEDYIPLAPTFTSTGGIFYKPKYGFNGGISYRYIKGRPANEDNTIIAKGYFLLDAAVNYTKPKYEIGLSVENLLNAQWNEAQFATTSRLKDEPQPVTELNFTPGMPLFIKAKVAIFF